MTEGRAFRRALWRARACGVMQGAAIAYGLQHRHRSWCPVAAVHVLAESEQRERDAREALRQEREGRQ